MWLIDKIAEQRIAEAEKRGDFKGLSGEGRPIELEENLHVPESLRVGYRMLKNAGYIPPEVQARKEIARLQQLLASIDNDDKQIRETASARLNYLLMKLNINQTGPLACENQYHQKIQRRLSGCKPDKSP